MTTTAYRIDAADRPDSDLIAAGTRQHVWADGTVEAPGVSVMESVRDLIDYLVAPEHMMTEVIYGAGPGGEELELVELVGEIVGTDSDGAPLLVPERVVRRVPLRRSELFGLDSDPDALIDRLTAEMEV